MGLRVWEIRGGNDRIEESRRDGYYGHRERDVELERAYREGCRDGYEKAVRESSGRYGERHGMADEYMRAGFRDDDDYRYGERRGRDSRGRFV